MFSILIKFINKLKGRDNPGLYDEHDVRTFGADSVFGVARKNDLTDLDFSTINIEPWINQGSTDFCVGTGKAYFKTETEGMRMSWAGAFAMGAKSIGSVPKWGISLLQVMRGAVKFGTPEESFWRFKEWNGTKASGRNYFADWRNMPESVLANARKHKDGSFVIIYSQYNMDRFDQFRAFLNKFHKEGEKVVIQTGVDAHNVTLIGQKKMNGEVKLYGPDSYGRRNYNYRVGKCVDGFRYFSRKEANQLFNGYLALDMPRELTELLHNYNGKAIKMKNDKNCYLVEAGKKRLLKNEAIAWAHGIYFQREVDLFEISLSEFKLIPTGKPVEFKSGPLHRLVVRATEKIIRKEPKTVDELINEA